MFRKLLTERCQSCKPAKPDGDDSGVPIKSGVAQCDADDRVSTLEGTVDSCAEKNNAAELVKTADVFLRAYAGVNRSCDCFINILGNVLMHMHLHARLSEADSRCMLEWMQPRPIRTVGGQSQDAKRGGFSPVTQIVFQISPFDMMNRSVFRETSPRCQGKLKLGLWTGTIEESSSIAIGWRGRKGKESRTTRHQGKEFGPPRPIAVCGVPNLGMSVCMHLTRVAKNTHTQR